MAKRYKVTLTEDERAQLRAMVSCGKAAARKWNHARMLLDAEESPEGMGRSAPQIHQALGVSSRSVARVRQRFVEEGFEAALNPRPRPRGAYKLTPEMESHIVALAKNDPPKGRKRWTLRLIWSRVTPRRGRCGWCWTT